MLYLSVIVKLQLQVNQCGTDYSQLMQIVVCIPALVQNQRPQTCEAGPRHLPTLALHQVELQSLDVAQDRAQLLHSHAGEATNDCNRRKQDARSNAVSKEASMT
jgi:hypothetical protein